MTWDMDPRDKFETTKARELVWRALTIAAVIVLFSLPFIAAALAGGI